MTQFLASVRCAAEAELVLAAGADIVDLKEPNAGALGAVAASVVRDCLEAIGGRKPVSATVGDLPMEPDRVANEVTATAELGVDTVKLGVLGDGDPQSCFEALRIRSLPAELVLVFFADALPGLDPIDAARASGARGVMLDTAGKGGASLTDYLPIREIQRFVEGARRAGLQAGLAGSLRARHIAPLLALRPDVMGFRGALCERGARDLSLDPVACAEIGQLVTTGRSASEARFEARAASAMC
ncbi:MAG: (5-formylfuran-3-yl)methyl phosphate synthase [Methyloceanibacter sp.]|nr:(5-formylfuran-3-yl)methyl phosphate synthase [Methyloceanibacter sp.]